MTTAGRLVGTEFGHRPRGSALFGGHPEIFLNPRRVVLRVVSRVVVFGLYCVSGGTINTRINLPAEPKNSVCRVAGPLRGPSPCCGLAGVTIFRDKCL